MPKSFKDEGDNAKNGRKKIRRQQAMNDFMAGMKRNTRTFTVEVGNGRINPRDLERVVLRRILTFDLKISVSRTIWNNIVTFRVMKENYDLIPWTEYPDSVEPVIRTSEPGTRRPYISEGNFIMA